jgi:hypothetical protein
MRRTTIQHLVSAPRCLSVVGCCRWSALFPRSFVTLIVASHPQLRRWVRRRTPSVASRAFLAASSLHSSVQACLALSRFRHHNKHRRFSLTPLSRLHLQPVRRRPRPTAPFAQLLLLAHQRRHAIPSPLVGIAQVFFLPTEITKMTLLTPRIPRVGVHHFLVIRPSFLAHADNPPCTRVVHTFSPLRMAVKLRLPTTTMTAYQPCRRVINSPFTRCSPPLWALHPHHHLHIQTSSPLKPRIRPSIGRRRHRRTCPPRRRIMIRQRRS